MDILVVGDLKSLQNLQHKPSFTTLSVVHFSNSLFKFNTGITRSYGFIKLVSMATQSKASTVFGRLNIGIAGLNPAQGMDVCLHLSVLCCPV
jgi:hypothetical protein